MKNRVTRGRAFAAVAAVGVLSVTLAACSSGSSSSSTAASAAPAASAAASAPAAGGDVAVSLITKNQTNPFFVAMAAGAKKAAEANGVTLTLASGKDDTDVAGQVTAIENAVAQGQKGILITPAGPGVNDAITAARAAGLWSSHSTPRLIRRASSTSPSPPTTSSQARPLASGQPAS